jgi:hypothetical protein
LKSRMPVLFHSVLAVIWQTYSKTNVSLHYAIYGTQIKAVLCLKIVTCDVITGKCFRGTCWLHHQGRSTHLVTHGGSRFLCNITNIYHTTYCKISGHGCL